MAFTECQLIHYLISVCLSSSLSAQCWQALSLSFSLYLPEFHLSASSQPLHSKDFFFGQAVGPSNLPVHCFSGFLFQLSCSSSICQCKTQDKTRQNNTQHTACLSAVFRSASKWHTHTHSHTYTGQTAKPNQVKLNSSEAATLFHFVCFLSLFSRSFSFSLSLFIGDSGVYVIWQLKSTLRFSSSSSGGSS